MVDKRDSTIALLFDKATKSYREISEIHYKLLKYGYNKPFSIFLEELKARLVYQKMLEN